MEDKEENKRNCLAIIPDCHKPGCYKLEKVPPRYRMSGYVVFPIRFIGYSEQGGLNRRVIAN